ncbi:MAG: SAM-dependent methyltransferase, partial [Pseudomonadales bacterium]|nr:SAM-dependent methyltransferase [Pseudomonadales bacterium]
ATLSLSPCCYHRLDEGIEHWAPRSTLATASTLDREALRLAAAGLATAPATVRRQRVRERIFRAAFDALQRTLTGQDRYRPVPSVPGRLLARGFPAFCDFAAAHQGVRLPEPLDAERWLAAGAAVEARARRLDLVRLAFSRLLELRIVLDRALALAEAGRRVQLGRFCDRSLTPRNLLIHAEP